MKSWFFLRLSLVSLQLKKFSPEGLKMRPNKSFLAVVGSALATSGASVMAAVPADVSTAIETAGTDATTVGGAVLVVIVGIFALKLLRRAL
jgi:hypothetical protein